MKAKISRQCPYCDGNKQVPLEISGLAEYLPCSACNQRGQLISTVPLNSWNVEIDQNGETILFLRIGKR